MKQMLIVEDEIIVARDLEALVDSLEYKVCGLATTGEDAIDFDVNVNRIWFSWMFPWLVLWTAPNLKQPLLL